MAAEVDSADTTEVHLTCGEQVLVATGLRLGAVADEHSEAITTELARRLDRWEGPGAVVLAGDTFELAEQPNNSPERALRSHPRLASALRDFVGSGHRLIVLPGRHDAELADDESYRNELRRLGATVTAACALTIETGMGTRQVAVRGGLGGPDTAAAEAASTRFWDRLRRRVWIPVAMTAATLTTGALIAWRRQVAPHHAPPWWMLYLVCSAISVLAIATVLVVWLTERGEPDARADHLDLDADARAAATGLLAGGVDGCILTGPATAELFDLGAGWFANPGPCRRLVTRRPTRFGLPAVHAPTDRVAWLELEAGAQLHVRLVLGQRESRPRNRAARMATRRRHDVQTTPAVMTELQPGVVWPAPDDAARANDAVRRRAALIVAFTGLINIVSAVTPALRGRRWLLRQVLPVDVPIVADGLVAAAGIALMVLAIGLRRGRRSAWQLATTLLTVSAAGHLLKGVDVEEAAIAALVATWLVLHREAFTARLAAAPRKAAIAVAAGLLVVAGFADAAIHQGTDKSWRRSAHVALARMVGVPADRLPSHLYFLAVVLPVATIVTLAILAWLAFRAHRPPPNDAATTERAWAIVRRHGSGTLDYFALRDDKRHFVVQDTVVAYTVINGAAVVSPDPIGPADQRTRAWSAFRAFADANGWRVAALGAAEQWLPIYHASGMTSMYIGDEAVIDVTTFRLDGGRHKSLRQAVNRVAGAGYTVEVLGSSDVPPALAEELRALSTQSRRGATERGYSMTLSRLLDPRDRDLLIVVARDPEGQAVAFCQFVPAPGIAGYSLDLMRRDPTAGRHPNGLIEFLVAGTIAELRERGCRGLGLHFATMRAVLAGDAGDRFWHRSIARLMLRLSADMQIESLWRFNAKFDPRWLPRYVVIDRPQSSLRAGLAIAQLESLWELPLIGRLLQPSADTLAG